MTFKEKLMEEYPEKANKEGFFLYFCPSQFGYEEVGKCKQMTCSIENCKECWDREVPVANTDEKTNSDPHILDSGTRREFETGAVRDIQEGKGRCDLMPLDVIAMVQGDENISYIYNFMLTGDHHWLVDMLRKMGGEHFNSISNMLLEVSKHFEDGAKKYGEHNWQKGIPTNCYIDSAVRHLLKWIRNDKDEPHDRAFVWNILCCIWTCMHKPELNVYKEKSNE